MNDKNRKIAIIIAAILGCVGLFYLGGMLGQLLGNYAAWMDSGGVSGENTMKPVSWNPLICFPAAFSGNGIKGILMILLIVGAIPEWLDLISHRTERIRFMREEEQRLANAAKTE